MSPFDPRAGSDPASHRMRVGDAEREQAAAALGEHYALGRLTDVEHGERLDAVWSARTRADLDVLFHDLPGHPGHAGYPGRPGAPAVARRSGLGIPTPVIVILAVMGAIVILKSPVLLLILLVVGFVIIKNRRRRARERYPAQHPGHYGRSGPLA